MFTPSSHPLEEKSVMDDEYQQQHYYQQEDDIGIFNHQEPNYDDLLEEEVKEIAEETFFNSEADSQVEETPLVREVLRVQEFDNTAQMFSHQL